METPKAISYTIAYRSTPPVITPLVTFTPALKKLSGAYIITCLQQVTVCFGSSGHGFDRE